MTIKSALYVVATPIGNLSDITLRAIEVLKGVDFIAAEDTRTTSVLLEKYEITTPLESYHKFNEAKKAEILIEKIKEGKKIALVSDAGTPLISDPGNIIVKNAIKEGVKVVPIGGISAVTTFLSSISRNDEDFKFIGFLPKIKGQIETILIENEKENLIFYESPLRIKETFEIICELRKNAIISIGRELSKKFEEIKTGTIEEIIEYYNSNPLKGEIVCMVHKNKDQNELDACLIQKVKDLLEVGFSQKQIVSILEITDKTNKNKLKAFLINFCNKDA